MQHSYAKFTKWAVLTLLTAATLYVVALVYLSGHLIMGSLVLGGYAIAAYVFSSRKAYTYRYLFPGLAGMALFVLFPLLFTVWIGFTNYSSSNILTFERATAVLLSQTYSSGTENYEFKLYVDGDRYRLVLEPEGAAGDEGDERDGTAMDEAEPDEGDSIFGDDGDAPDDPGDDTGDDTGEDTTEAATDDRTGATADTSAEDDSDSIFADEDADAGAGSDAGASDAGSGGGVAGPAATEPAEVAPAPADELADKRGPLVTRPFSLRGSEPITVAAMPLGSAGVTLGEPLSIKDIIDRQSALDQVTVTLPGQGQVIKTGLRVFSGQKPLYLANPDRSLTNQQTGQVLRPSAETGFYHDQAGESVTPGYRVVVGFDNFVRIFTDPSFQGPFFKIFVWTVVFAALTVLLSLIVGTLLCELLDWEGLRFRGMYRLLLFLPYAVPGFISILVFKGLFSENSGEINLIVSRLFGIKPQWFSDPMLAKIMILIVNTWLGYPYIMLLCMGLRQSISKDLYEASALAGAGPMTNFFKITWPLIRRPLAPLLISSFAYNFNNFVLIALLTGGRPDFTGTSVPAGTTDILVSYTYRIAFEDSGKNFGLAAAISTVIFFMVAVMSLINLRLTRVTEADKR